MCIARRHDRLLTLLEGKPDALRRLTLRAFAQLSRAEHTIPPHDGLFVFDRGGSGGGGTDAALLRRSGEFTSSSTGSRPRADVNGVIPDGVVSITVTYDRRVNRGPYENPKVYPLRIVRNVRVQDNVVDFTVPRPADTALRTRMIWHLVNGRTRVVTQPHG